MTTLNYITDDARIPRPKLSIRSAGGKFKTASGESYIGNVLAFMGDKFNRERALPSWPYARRRAIDQMVAHTGHSEKAVENYCSIVRCLAIDFKTEPRTTVEDRKIVAVDQYSPTLLIKLQGTSLDTAREVDALCQLARSNVDLKSLLQSAIAGKPASAVARRLDIVKWRNTSADRQEELAKEIRSWPLEDRERHLAMIVLDIARGGNRDDLCLADASMSEILADRTLQDIEQRGLAQSDMLRERGAALEELQCKYRDMRLHNAEQLDAETSKIKRVRRFRQQLKTIAKGRSEWIPGEDFELISGSRDVANENDLNGKNGYRHGKMPTRKSPRYELKEPSATTTSDVERCKMELLIEKNTMYEIKILPKLIDDLRHARVRNQALNAALKQALSKTSLHGKPFADNTDDADDDGEIDPSDAIAELDGTLQHDESDADDGQDDD